jgi:ribosomal protein S18 acetylase RimI-like enzyme
MTKNADVIIRDATEANLDRVAELWTEMIDLHRDLDERFWVRKPDAQESFRKSMAESLGNAQRVLVVAEVDGRVAGFGHGSICSEPTTMSERPCAFISDVSIGFDFRGKGIGRKLMDAATARLAALGAEDLTLATAVKNECAVGFYEDLGFERHMITMWKSLG